MTNRWFNFIIAVVCLTNVSSGWAADKGARLVSDGQIETDEIDFDTEIVPLFSKAGCNNANCHGSVAGRGGFRLSLFGGDPAMDYRTIVRELTGRRIHPIQPRESLIIRKPTADLEHGGGDIWGDEDAAVTTLIRWIATGAKRLQLRRLEHLLVEPNEFHFHEVPSKATLKVTAVFNDGHRREVTDQAVYQSHNESALLINESGQIRLRSPGQHTATVQFGGWSKSVSVSAPVGPEMPDDLEFSNQNWIDEEVNQKLRQIRLRSEGICDDATFVRRVWLDLAGRLPTPMRSAAFVHDNDPAKRIKLIDQLLESEAFVEFWTHRFAVLLRLRQVAQDSVASDAFAGWLREQIADEAGWDQIASDVILAEGDSLQRGAAMVHRMFATAREEAEYVSEVFMGVRLRCANCHNHPLDRWTQDDYHGLAAIFAGMQRDRVVRFSSRMTVNHPRTNQAAVPRLPGGRFLRPGHDNRQLLADWLTDGSNPYFARAMSGRIWQWLMGRGLVSPVDDLRMTNPASHPRLLDRLAECLIDHDFRIRPLIRLVCRSAAYQRASLPWDEIPSDIETQFYTCAVRKPIDAEVLADAINDVTGVPDVDLGTRRTIELVDRETASQRLRFLGQCPPGNNCSSPTGSRLSVASKLQLLNGDLLNQKIASPRGRLQRMLSDKVPVSELVNEFYWRAFNRPPTERELDDWGTRLGASNAEERRQRCEDFLWAILNSQEFTSNH